MLAQIFFPNALTMEMKEVVIYLQLIKNFIHWQMVFNYITKNLQKKATHTLFSYGRTRKHNAKSELNP
jgi:hypothetical protein